jgi:exosortase/archaeosortase family protein
LKAARHCVAKRTSRGNLLLLVTVLAWLWFVLINELRVEWTVNPQYTYGWAVPFLCAYLIFEKAKNRNRKSEIRNKSLLRPPSSVLIVLCALLALLYAPTRLVEEANPGWRLVSWALAVEVIGITLCSLRLMLPATEVGGQQAEIGKTPHASRFTFQDFVFPICFFLVAVPWPSPIEMPLIQGLTRVDTACATELLGWIGIPAMPHGNVIEVATGTVGIDEACSGIRSFQATLMISLFLGELYRLNFIRRAGLVLGGFALSFLFNLARMTLLVWVAARKGVSAIESWHDPAGVTILLGCFFGLWGLGVLLRNAETLKTETLKVEGDGRAPEAGEQRLETERQKTESDGRTTNFSISAFALFFWILLSEISIEAWYRAHEARLPHATQWTVAFPTDNPTFKQLPLSGRTREILRYDEGRSVAWDENGTGWQAVFLRWDPGRTALRLAQNHTPEVCMTAAGRSLKVLSQLQWFEVSGAPVSQSAKTAVDDRADSSRSGVRRSEVAGTNILRLPFAIYEIKDTDRPFYVFYCLWNDRANTQTFETMGLTRGIRLAAVLAGIRNPGQRSLEIAVSGLDSTAAAKGAVQAELEKLITSK